MAQQRNIHLFHSLLGQTTSSYLLDDYPVGSLGAAWSLRLLSSTHDTTKCIKVRRSSDNAELDIGFSGGVLDETALLAHVGTGGTDDGFVTTWYEQSGNTATSAFPFNLVNTTPGNQPKIVSAGVVEKLNGKPTIVPGAATFSRLNYEAAWGALDGSYPKTQPMSIFMIGNYDTSQLPSGFPTMAWDTGVNNGIFNNWGTWQWGMPYTSGPTITALPDGPQRLVTSIFNSPAAQTDSYLYVNGTVDAAANGVNIGAATWNRMYVLSNYNTSEWRGTMQEFVIYDSSVTSDRAVIETEINNFYGMY